MNLRNIYYLIKSIYINLRYKNIRVSYTSKIKQLYKPIGPFKIGANTFFSGKIGRYSYIGENCVLNAEIGNFCSIASNVKIIEGFHPIHRFSTSPVFYSVDGQCIKSFVTEKKVEDIKYIKKDEKIACIIGNDVWIGENVLIKGGIKIGDGACIAMGSVVVKDIEPFSIVGGVPAREIKKRFSRDIIEKLLKIQWWNKDDTWLKSMENYYDFIDTFIEEAEKK